MTGIGRVAELSFNRAGSPAVKGLPLPRLGIVASLAARYVLHNRSAHDCSQLFSPGVLSREAADLEGRGVRGIDLAPLISRQSPDSAQAALELAVNSMEAITGRKTVGCFGQGRLEAIGQAMRLNGKAVAVTSRIEGEGARTVRFYPQKDLKDDVLVELAEGQSHEFARGTSITVSCDLPKAEQKNIAQHIESKMRYVRGVRVLVNGREINSHANETGIREEETGRILGTIEIVVSDNGYVVRDDGKGMSVETIVKRYLAVGNSEGQHEKSYEGEPQMYFPKAVKGAKKGRVSILMCGVEIEGVDIEGMNIEENLGVEIGTGLKLNAAKNRVIFGKREKERMLALVSMILQRGGGRRWPLLNSLMKAIDKIEFENGEKEDLIREIIIRVKAEASGEKNVLFLPNEEAFEHLNANMPKVYLDERLFEFDAHKAGVVEHPSYTTQSEHRLYIGEFDGNVVYVKVGRNIIVNSRYKDNVLLINILQNLYLDYYESPPPDRVRILMPWEAKAADQKAPPAAAPVDGAPFLFPRLKEEDKEAALAYAAVLVRNGESQNNAVILIEQIADRRNKIQAACGINIPLRDLLFDSVEFKQAQGERLVRRFFYSPGGKVYLSCGHDRKGDGAVWEVSDFGLKLVASGFCDSPEIVFAGGETFISGLKEERGDHVIERVVDGKTCEVLAGHKMTNEVYLGKYVVAGGKLFLVENGEMKAVKTWGPVIDIENMFSDGNRTFIISRATAPGTCFTSVAEIVDGKAINRLNMPRYTGVEIMFQEGEAYIVVTDGDVPYEDIIIQRVSSYGVVQAVMMIENVDKHFICGEKFFVVVGISSDDGGPYSIEEVDIRNGERKKIFESDEVVDSVTVWRGKIIISASCHNARVWMIEGNGSIKPLFSFKSREFEMECEDAPKVIVEDDRAFILFNEGGSFTGEMMRRGYEGGSLFEVLENGELKELTVFEKHNPVKIRVLGGRAYYVQDYSGQSSVYSMVGGQAKRVSGYVVEEHVDMFGCGWRVFFEGQPRSTGDKIGEAYRTEELIELAGRFVALPRMREYPNKNFTVAFSRDLGQGLPELIPERIAGVFGPYARMEREKNMLVRCITGDYVEGADVRIFGYFGGAAARCLGNELTAQIAARIKGRSSRFVEAYLGFVEQLWEKSRGEIAPELFKQVVDRWDKLFDVFSDDLAEVERTLNYFNEADIYRYLYDGTGVSRSDEAGDWVRYFREPSLEAIVRRRHEAEAFNHVGQVLEEVREEHDLTFYGWAHSERMWEGGKKHEALVKEYNMATRGAKPALNVSLLWNKLLNAVADRGLRKYAYVREAAENSMRAGSRKLEVNTFTCERNENVEHVAEFVDDGCGMTDKEVKELLLNVADEKTSNGSAGERKGFKSLFSDADKVRVRTGRGDGQIVEVEIRCVRGGGKIIGVKVESYKKLSGQMKGTVIQVVKVMGKKNDGRTHVRTALRELSFGRRVRENLGLVQDMEVTFNGRDVKEKRDSAENESINIPGRGAFSLLRVSGSSARIIQNGLYVNQDRTKYLEHVPEGLRDFTEGCVFEVGEGISLTSGKVDFMASHEELGRILIVLALRKAVKDHLAGRKQIALPPDYLYGQDREQRNGDIEGQISGDVRADAEAVNSGRISDVDFRKYFGLKNQKLLQLLSLVEITGEDGGRISLQKLRDETRNVSMMAGKVSVSEDVVVGTTFKAEMERAVSERQIGQVAVVAEQTGLIDEGKLHDELKTYKAMVRRTLDAMGLSHLAVGFYSSPGQKRLASFEMDFSRGIFYRIEALNLDIMRRVFEKLRAGTVDKEVYDWMCEFIRRDVVHEAVHAEWESRDEWSHGPKFRGLMEMGLARLIRAGFTPFVI